MIKKVSAFFKWFSQKTTKDATAAYSGEAALYIIISLFPFLMFLLTLLQFLPFTREQLLEVLSRFLPSIINSYLDRLVLELYTTSGTVLSITVILTLWTASRGVLTIYRGLNSVNGIEETRNYFFLRLRSMLYTFAFCIMLLMLLGLYVFGNQIKSGLTEHFPVLMHNRFAILIVTFRNAIGIVIMSIFFLLMYTFMPNRKSKLLRQLPGALIAALGWMGFSYLYSLYIDNMGSIKTTYGSLTAAVLCILWLYACMNIFFFGAEVNTILYTPEIQKEILHFIELEHEVKEALRQKRKERKETRKNARLEKKEKAARQKTEEEKQP